MAQITQSVTGSLNSIGGITQQPKTQIDPNALYAVNWNSLQKVEDLVLILASLGFAFAPEHPQWETIKHLLDTQNPIYPQGQPTNDDFKSIELNLPSLKKV